jgi:hypothetical protein
MPAILAFVDESANSHVRFERAPDSFQCHRSGSERFGDDSQARGEVSKLRNSSVLTTVDSDRPGKATVKAGVTAKGR